MSLHAPLRERLQVAHITPNDDERRLIDRIRDRLQGKKYLIVIDDIWSTEVWKIIRNALLNNDNGSRIITTTRNSTVASFCSSQGDYVYRMQPLSSANSRRLFLERAFRSEDLCPSSLREVSESILEKCAGLPLAIITMSSLLADQTAEEVWRRALAAIGSSLAKEGDAGDMRKILSLSYFDLPHPMRTCLLYFSAFPEDYVIPKRSLIHKWIAEGFIHDEQGQSAYEVGEGYFNELINRSLVQPTNLIFSTEKYGEVEACRVHDIILDFIACKAKEENFMAAIGDAEQGENHKVRRLSVVSRDHESATVSGDFSHIRSLVLFGNFSGQKCALDFPALGVLDFPALRVLDMGQYWDLKDSCLANIGKLHLLKYLRLRSGSIPAGIGGLKYLETLHMYGNSDVKTLPPAMTRLQRLSRLYGKFAPSCLSDGIIGQLQSLEELDHVEVEHTEVYKLRQELGQLSKLRTLSVAVKDDFFRREKEDALRFLRTLFSEHNIQHLHIAYSPYGSESAPLSLESWCPANPATFRKICILSHMEKVPTWMVSLVNLRELVLRVCCTRPEDMAVLGGIPALAFLELETYYGRNGRIFIQRRGFTSLKYFNLSLKRCGTAVEFEEGSMPKLEQLQLRIKAHKMECVNYASDFGIQHLSALTKAHITIDGDYETEAKIRGLMKTAIGKLRNRPALSLHGSRPGDDQRCRHFE